MKFSCDKKTLSDATFNVSLAVSSKSTLVALEGVLLSCDGNELTLTGYNLDLGITKNIDVKGQENGSIVLNAKLFSDILRKMNSDQITIHVDDKMVTTIVGNGTEFTILGINANEFPEMPTQKDENCFSIPCHLLKNMITQTIFSVALTEQTPIHTGSLFDVKDGVLNIVSVDGYRLAKRSEKIDINDEFSFVVPGNTLREIIKLLPEEEDISVNILYSNRHIIFDIDGYTVTSRLLDGEFLNYRSSISDEHLTRIKINVKNFISSIERASIIITDRIKSPIKCVFEEETAAISCETAMGKFNDSIEVSIDGNGILIGFNNRYLLEALKACECDEVYLDINGPLLPMKIVPLESDSFLFLVLPVRLAG